MAMAIYPLVNLRQYPDNLRNPLKVFNFFGTSHSRIALILSGSGNIVRFVIIWTIYAIAVFPNGYFEDFKKKWCSDNKEKTCSR